MKKRGHGWRFVRHQGFTLIELMVTVGIVGVLATAALSLAEISVQRNKEHALRIALWKLREAIDNYKRAVDEGRVASHPDASGYPPSLESLVEGVVDSQDPEGRRRIYFLRRLPRDPMAEDETVPAAATWGRRSYASPPEAPLEGEDVFDIYSRSEGVGLNGVPYREW